MIFTSITFLAFYILLIATLSLVRGQKYREYLLLIASYIFYGAWNPIFIVLIAVSSFWGWALGIKMHRADSQKKRYWYTAMSLMLSLSMLVFFKYANFFAESVTSILGLSWKHANIVLPVGISFFTFQTMSYTIDIYRGHIPVCLSLRRFLLFVAFFPQLVAGPIVRASKFLPQLEKPIQLKRDDFIVGGQLFLGGAIQKVRILVIVNTDSGPS